MNENLFGKIEFIVLHIWTIWSTLELFLASKLFRCMGSFAISQSKWIIMGVLLLSSVIGISISIKKQRNLSSLGADMLNGYGIYLYLVEGYSDCGIILLGIIIFFSIVFGGCILGRKIRCKKKIRVIVLERIRKTMMVSWRISAIGMSVFMLLLCVTDSDALYIVNSNSTIEVNIDEREMWKKLKEDEWSQLNKIQRLEVLQWIVANERQYLGITHAVDIKVLNLPGSVSGYYDDKTREIAIDEEVLMRQAHENVQLMLHEMFHCYQHRLIELYEDASLETKQLRVFNEVSSWGWEFENYYDLNKGGYDLYYDQKCEKSARNYAKSRMVNYINYAVDGEQF